VIGTVVILAAGYLAMLGLGSAEAESSGIEDSGVLNVQVDTAKVHTEGIDFQVDGVVVPYRRVQTAAEVAGRVTFKSDDCQSGRVVHAGEVLVRINPRDYQLEIDRLNKELAQAKSNLTELDVEIKNSENVIALVKEELQIRKRELDRFSNVADKGVFSEAEIDAARRNELVARNSLQSSQDQMTLQKSRRSRFESGRDLVLTQLEKAALELERCEVQAPIDGLIVSEHVEQDDYLQKGAMIFTIQDTSSVEVQCRLRMNQLHWLWQSEVPNAAQPDNDDGGMQQAYGFPETDVDVSYSVAGNRYTWKGMLKSYDGAGVDEQTRMIPARVFVPDPLSGTADQNQSVTGQSRAPALMTGLYVSIHITATPQTPLIKVPRLAVRPGDVVWVVNDGEISRRKLAIAHANEEFVLIYQESNGLQPGEAVVTSPLAAPSDGTLVTVRKVDSVREDSVREDSVREDS
jgi:RND family efflux transporter MFP subunit